MFTKSQELRDEAVALDFLHGYTVADLIKLGSLQRLIQTIQEGQVARGTLEETVKQLMKDNADLQEDVHNLQGASIVPKKNKKLN